MSDALCFLPLGISFFSFCFGQGFIYKAVRADALALKSLWTDHDRCTACVKERYS